MIIPVRCFTCGKPLGSEYEQFKERVDKGEKPKEVMDSLGVEKYCCRRMLLSQADLYEEITEYES